jgi:pimeloyl-ACP methyl ester carboxylesterase
MAREWKEKGVYYVINGRTKQEMPLYYQLYEDTVLNAERFSVKNALAKSNLPLLILHGDSDETLPLGMAKMLREWSKNSEFHIIAGANHAFGGSHPYPSTELPEKFLQVAEITESFMKKHLR